MTVPCVGSLMWLLLFWFGWTERLGVAFDCQSFHESEQHSVYVNNLQNWFLNKSSIQTFGSEKFDLHKATRGK